MVKKIISIKDIEDACEKTPVFCFYALFTAAGFAVVFGALRNLLSNYNTSNLIGFLVVGGLFGAVFGYFLGIRNIIYALRRTALIKNGGMWFVIDEVTDKYYSTNGSDGSTHKDFQLELQKYTAKTNRRLFLRTRKEYDAVNLGDPCILGFTKLSKRPFCVFAGQQYELDAQLRGKVIPNMK